MDFLILISVFVVLIFSVMIHELAHGYVAFYLGDLTAKREGRLTLNPLKHIDIFGSVMLPLILFVLTFGAGPIFGWAKPVPINPHNLKGPKGHSRWGMLKVAIAGPATNFLLAIIFGLINRILPMSGEVKLGILISFLSGNYNALNSFLALNPLSVLFLFFTIVSIYNFLWGIFNLIPIPPLDGSWILFNFLPMRFDKIKLFLHKNGLFILVFLVIFGALYFLSETSLFLYRFIAGI